jgi:hypothetical protein
MSPVLGALNPEIAPDDDYAIDRACRHKKLLCGQALLFKRTLALAAWKLSFRHYRLHAFAIRRPNRRAQFSGGGLAARRAARAAFNATGAIVPVVYVNVRDGS